MSFRSYQSKAFALYERYVLRGSTGVYATDPGLRDQDIDACWETAVQAKPIVDPLPAAENSSRLSCTWACTTRPRDRPTVTSDLTERLSRATRPRSGSGLPSKFSSKAW